MKNSIFNLLIVVAISGIILSLNSCKEEVNGIVTSGWAINENEIGGKLVPWPLINDPGYISVGEVRDLDSSSAVLIYKAVNDIYVYPVKEISRVEIVNDIIDRIPLAITYCPLTKSGICWERTFQGKILNFTPSGFLFQSNLMPYDFETESIWSQMRLEGVFGSLKKVRVKTHQLVETRWFNVEMYFPSAKVFSRKISGTSNGRVSGDNAGSTGDTGELVFGVVGKNQVNVFSYASFEDQIKLYAHFGDDDVIVVGSKTHGFINAFQSNYQMHVIRNEFPVIMQDDAGTKWNIFGEGLNGPHQGEKLVAPSSYFASGWAFDKIFKDRKVVGK